MRKEKVKKSRKGLFWAALSLAGFLCAGAAVGGLCLHGSSANAADAVVEIQTTYLRGETLTVPSDATISLGSGTDPIKATTAYLVYPGGNAYRGWSFELSECGQYKLVLEGHVNQKLVSASTTFGVTDSLYTLGNEASSVTYGDLNYA